VSAPKIPTKFSSPARLKALVNTWFGWARRAGLPGGCPVAAGLFEYDDVAGPVRDKIAQMEAEWRGLLSALTLQAIQRRHFRRDLDVDQFVWELCGVTGAFPRSMADLCFLRALRAELLYPREQ
jgi:hypothetical protein